MKNNNDPNELGGESKYESPGQELASTTPQIKSDLPLSDWRGSITTFKGFTGTTPFQELKHLTLDAIKEVIAPSSPAIIDEKGSGKFFVSCALKVAPLVGNTLEGALKNGLPSTGKMRSKSHVTEAAMLVLDVDGLSEADFKAGLAQIKCDGLTYLAYTTHSHGREDKPGMRVRLAVPVDRPLNIAEYAAAWHGLDHRYFSGHAGKADSSGANLYQQQGTWCAHPDRAIHAQCWSNHGGLASADVLIEMSGVELTSADDLSHRSAKVTLDHSLSGDAYPPSDAFKIADACQQIGEFRDTQGAHQSEPLWFDCLGVVGYCVNGAEVCQEWSNAHPGYDERKTAVKLAYRLRMPPTTCAQFFKTNPDGCIGCRNRCRSPITLGWLDSFVAGVNS